MVLIIPDMTPGLIKACSEQGTPWYGARPLTITYSVEVHGDDECPETRAEPDKK